MQIIILLLSLALIGCGTNSSKSDEVKPDGNEVVVVLPTTEQPRARESNTSIVVGKKNLSVFVSSYAASRSDAELSAVSEAVVEGLENYSKDILGDPYINEWIKNKLLVNRKQGYSSLVKRWLLDVDTATQKGYLLEGRVILRASVLRRWLKEYSNGVCNKNQSRFSLYLQPDTQDLYRDGRWQKKYIGLMGAVKQRFLDGGFPIVQESSKSLAQYRLVTSQIKYDGIGLKESLSFNVDIVENQAGGELVATIDDTSFATGLTPAATEKELNRRTADKIYAGLSRNLIIGCKESIEVIFHAPATINKYRAKNNLEKELAKLFGYRSRVSQSDFIDNLNTQITRMGDKFVFSIKTNGMHEIGIRALEEGLLDIQNFVFGSAQADIAKSTSGTKWLVFDSEDRPSYIEL